MARYKLTPQDRSKGGKTTAERYDMRERGLAGFRSFADRYFAGDTDLAGKALSKVGNFVTDPARWNGAWALPNWFPDNLREPLLNRYSRTDDAIPF